MATTRQSRGIGTGQAVSYDTGINSSLGNFFDVVNQKNLIAQKDKRENDEKEKKSLEELYGQWDDYDYTKMKTSDIPVLEKMIAEDRDLFKGHYKDIINNDPYWTNLYQQKTSQQKKFIANSVQSRPQFVEMMKKMQEPDSGYSPERMAELENAYLTGGVHWDQVVDQGIVSPDTIIGNPFVRVDEIFADSGDELYDIKKTSFPSKDGSKQITSDVKVWKDDEKAYPIFKENVTRTPRVMSDMNLMFPNLEGDEQIQAFYDSYKQSRRQDKKDVDVRLRNVDSGGSGGSDSKFEYGIKTEKIRSRGDKRGEKSDRDIMTIGRKSGSGLAPITVNGQTGIVSEIIREPNGEIKIVRSITKDDLSGNITLTGETVVEDADPTILSHLQSKYGIDDINKFIDERKGGVESSNVDKEALRNKYNY